MRYGLKNLMLAVACVTAITVAGCAAMGTFATAITPTVTKLVDDGVAIALTVELSKDPLTTKIKAIAFKAIAEQVLADSTNPTVSLGQLEATFNAKLAAQAPNPVVAMAIVDFVGGLQGAINNGASKLLSDPAAKPVAVHIASLASVVIRVCSFYGA